MRSSILHKREDGQFFGVYRWGEYDHQAVLPFDLVGFTRSFGYRYDAINYVMSKVEVPANVTRGRDFVDALRLDHENLLSFPFVAGWLEALDFNVKHHDSLGCYLNGCEL